jgi:hypothetical protein
LLEAEWVRLEEEEESVEADEGGSVGDGIIAVVVAVAAVAGYGSCGAVVVVAGAPDSDWKMGKSGATVSMAKLMYEVVA